LGGVVLHTEIGLCTSQYAWRSIPNLPMAGFDNCYLSKTKAKL